MIYIIASPFLGTKIQIGTNFQNKKFLDIMVILYVFNTKRVTLNIWKWVDIAETGRASMISFKFFEVSWLPNLHSYQQICLKYRGKKTWASSHFPSL